MITEKDIFDLVFFPEILSENTIAELKSNIKYLTLINFYLDVKRLSQIQILPQKIQESLAKKILIYKI
jgi:hypothetical protein